MIIPGIPGIPEPSELPEESLLELRGNEKIIELVVLYDFMHQLQFTCIFP
jgi:hypothetical protein